MCFISHLILCHSDLPCFSDAAGDVYCLTTQIACFVEPLQSANETFLHSHACSMLCGDVNNAIQNILVHAVGSFWCGLHLDKVKDNLEATARLATKYGYTSWLRLVTHSLQIQHDRNFISLTLLGSFAVSSDPCRGLF